MNSFFGEHLNFGIGDIIDRNDMTEGMLFEIFIPYNFESRLICMQYRHIANCFFKFEFKKKPKLKPIYSTQFLNDFEYYC